MGRMCLTSEVKCIGGRGERDKGDNSGKKGGGKPRGDPLVKGGGKPPGELPCERGSLLLGRMCLTHERKFICGRGREIGPRDSGKRVGSPRGTPNCCIP